MKLFLFIVLVLRATVIHGQDSTASVYINELVGKIEGRLATDILEKSDTTIYDDSLQTGEPLIIHTDFYTDPRTLMLDKIFERSLYRKISTEMTVYFSSNQPVLFTNKQWNGSQVKVDFDIYYMNDQSVHFIRRQLAGSINGGEYLKWCYELKREYDAIVSAYDQTFHHGKLR